MHGLHLTSARRAGTWAVAAAMVGALVALTDGVVVAVASPATGAPRGAATAAPGADAPTGKSRATAGRTLDAITIEGEIAVPQVLFITSREQPRYRDLLHRRFLRTSVDVGEQVGLPTRVVIKESRP